MARYNVMLVRRTPSSGSGPTFDIIDEIIIHEKLTWSDELLTDGGQITFALVPDNQSVDIRNVLLDIAETPCEIWLYRDDQIVQAGPVIGVQTQGSTINIVARALAYYLKYMKVTSDLSYTNVDQYTIGKGLIDQFQALTYGDYGIDTSSIGTSGVTRTIDYKAAEFPQVYSALLKLSENINGFEWYVDPFSREMVFTDRRGADKSADVILDSRAIVSPNTHFSVAEGDYGNHAIAIGSTEDAGAEAIIGEKIDATALAKFGRVMVGVSIDGATTQATVDDYAETLRDSVNQVYFIPSVGTVYPVLGAGVMDITPGDTVHWVYDYGLGKFRTDRDVSKRYVNVNLNGDETMTVELL